jgi:hypothetical protein
VNKILRINSSSYSVHFFIVIFKKSIRIRNILYSEKHIEGHFFEKKNTKITEGGSLKQGIVFAQLFAVKHVLDFQIFDYCREKLFIWVMKIVYSQN